MCKAIMYSKHEKWKGNTIGQQESAARPDESTKNGNSFPKGFCIVANESKIIYKNILLEK